MATQERAWSWGADSLSDRPQRPDLSRVPPGLFGDYA